MWKYPALALNCYEWGASIERMIPMTPTTMQIRYTVRLQLPIFAVSCVHIKFILSGNAFMRDMSKEVAVCIC